MCAAPLGWLGCFTGPSLIGALAWTSHDGEIEIHRLIVAPEAHRRGVGTNLVRCMLQRAGQRRTVVATGRGNTPARVLYERLGFDLVREEEVLPGLWVVRYAHAR